MSSSRTLGLELPKTSQQLLSFILGENSFNHHIFSHKPKRKDFVLSKAEVGKTLLDAFLHTRSSWKTRHEAKLGSNVRTIKSAAMGYTTELWSFFDPRESRKAPHNRVYVETLAKRKFGGEVKKSFFYSNRGKDAYATGIVPLGIAYRIRVYHGSLPPGIKPVTDKDDASVAKQIRLGVGGNIEALGDEIWVAIGTFERESQGHEYTLTKKGMAFSKKHDFVQKPVKAVRAKSEREAIDKLKVILKANMRSNKSVLNLSPEEAYFSWEMNDFKVLPKLGLTGYPRSSHKQHFIK